MTSERRTTQGEVPDAVVDRAAGYTHNPNPEDELEIQRARFAETQQQIQQDRQEAAEIIEEVHEQLVEQYQVAEQHPEHQAFIPEQEHAQEELGSATHGGQFDTSGADLPETIGGGEWMRRVPRPVPPSADQLPDSDRS